MRRPYESPERRAGYTVLAALAIGLAAPNAARAQESWPRITIRAGGLIADVASRVQVNTSFGEDGTDIDLEDDLGFDSNATTYFIDGVWRLSRRNQLQAGFVNVKRDVLRVFPSRTFTFRDRTFAVDSQIDSFVDTWYLTVNYGFAFVANPQAEFGVTIGFTAMRIHTGVGVSVGTDRDEDVPRDLDENAEFTAPIPLPGLFLNLRPAARVELNGSFRLIKASIDKLDGTMWEAQVGGDVKLWRHLGVGAAYYFNSSDLDRDGRLWDGGVEYDFSGPQIYVTVGL